MNYIKTNLREVISGFLCLFRFGLFQPPKSQMVEFQENFLRSQKYIDKAFEKLKDNYERNQKILRK